MDLVQLQNYLKEYDQEHLLQFWSSLTIEEQHELSHELKK